MAQTLYPIPMDARMLADALSFIGRMLQSTDRYKNAVQWAHLIAKTRDNPKFKDWDYFDRLEARYWEALYYREPF